MRHRDVGEMDLEQFHCGLTIVKSCDKSGAEYVRVSNISDIRSARLLFATDNKGLATVLQAFTVSKKKAMLP